MNRRLAPARLLGGLALAVCLCAPHAARAQPLRVAGNTSTLELAPVLLAAQELGAQRVAVKNGGIPSLFEADAADLATNAETQALRQSVDHPDLRVVLTVAEGFYRVVARRSAGVHALDDLRGKRIATAPSTSSAFYLYKTLATVGLEPADVTIVPLSPLSKMPPALEAHEIDALTIWEPEIQRAADLVGADAIEFQDRSVYRELFNLYATAKGLANPAKRREIVAFVHALVEASARVRDRPRDVWPLVAKRTGYDVALIEKVWRHEGYPATLAADLLDVMVEEDAYLAPERNRAPRSRAQLAALIDDSVLREALRD
jgi:ABC-type nitrate/sulfonate/bicarbonate transport system substrate-binding protein